MNTSTLLFRDATFGAEFDTAARTVPVTLSTEYAVDRGGYHEVLSHRDGDVDLSRAPLPLIIAHDDETLPVGTIEQLRVQDRALKGVARFGTWPRAAEAFEGVRSRIYRAVSVGYELLDDGRPESGNRNHLRFRWRPHEASIVAVGADPHAQFFRERTNMTTELSRAERRRVAAQSDAQQLLDVAGDDAAAFEEFLDEEANEHGGQRAAAVRALGGSISLAYENWRARCINLLARSWTDTIPNVLQLGKRAIAAGDSVEDFRLRLLPLIENKPLETGKLESGYQETAASYGSGARAASHFEARNDRERVERIHHAAGRWMRGSLLGSAADASWCRSAGLLQTRAAMAEGIYSAGGAAVPGLLADAVLVQSEEYGIARKECRVWPMTGAALGLPKELSAPSAGFVGENAQIPSTTPELGGLMLVPKILASLVPVSRSLAEDSIPELLGAYLLEALARRVAEVEDTCLFTADASSTYGGMTGLARMIEDPLYAGSKHTSLSGDNTLNEIELSDVTALLALLPERAKKTAKLYMSSGARDAVLTRLAASANGNDTLSLQSAVSRWAGYEVVLTPTLPSGANTDHAGRAVMLFGSLKQVSHFGDRRALELAWDSSFGFDRDQLTLRATTRFDIVHDLPKSTTVAGGVVGLVLNT